MLIESAFSILPESVSGFGFQKVQREANAVSCFAFSLLNALHAKNVLDPIQRIQLEKHYETRTVPLPAAGVNRHCDIFLDYGGSKIGTAALANYGWRYLNYVEAKFLKSYSLTASGQERGHSSHSAEIIADLVRLCVLVPEPQAAGNVTGAKTSSARYFLCLSDHKPEIFINQYLTSLRAVFTSPPKSATVSLDLTTGKASGALSERVGRGFNCLNLQITHATCFAHYPLNPLTPLSLWMLLIRVDEATVSMNDSGTNRSFTLNRDRSIVQGAVGDYVAIRNYVAANIR